MPAGLVGLVRASFWGALFLWTATACAQPLCPAAQVDERVRVAYVIDGDTLILRDGRKLRLIGVNTPELGHDGKQADPLAEDARRFLQRLVRESGGQIDIRLGSESRDRHGRLLAHAYQTDGDCIEARLIEAGLAARVAIPPNVENQDCLARVEDTARAQARGIWNLPAYRAPVETRRLGNDASGFMLIQGRVEHVGGSRHTQWINLEGGVSLKIDHDLMPWFKDMNLKQLKGHRIEARGWLTRPYGKNPRMRLTHPSMIRILD